MQADAAYGRLMSARREEAGTVYWSPTRILPNKDSSDQLLHPDTE